MERIVPDTNIIVSAFIWGGRPKLLIDSIISQGGILLSSRELLHELETTFQKAKLQKHITLSGKTSGEIISEYARLTQVVEPAPVPEESVRDPKDVKVLACALGGQASYIVTGDDDLLVLKTFQDIKIITASELLEIVQKP